MLSTETKYGGRRAMPQRSKVEVGALELGMYVIELDRPWIESPFLFQGFVLETEEDLQQIREICAWVMVDEELSKGDARDRTIALSMKMKADGKADKPTTIVRAEAMSEQK